MLIDVHEADNVYRQEPEHDLKPICAWCGDTVYFLAMDNSWLWFIYKGKLYYAHAECMQNNVSPKEADGFSKWLGKMQTLATQPPQEPELELCTNCWQVTKHLSQKCLKCGKES